MRGKCAVPEGIKTPLQFQLDIKVYHWKMANHAVIIICQHRIAERNACFNDSNVKTTKGVPFAFGLTSKRTITRHRFKLVS